MDAKTWQRLIYMERSLTLEFENELVSLFASILQTYNYDFTHYSKQSMKRRLIHAMNQMSCKTLMELQIKIIENSELFFTLLDYITIPVSEFFRDPSYFLSIREKVVPFLRTFPSLKIWIAGCSTGEEVYSFAILLQEEGLLDQTLIYASDINPKSLEIAKGYFSIQRVAEI